MSSSQSARLRLVTENRVTQLAALFGRAMLMSLLQSAGVVLLAKHSSWSLATAFLISYQWAGNSRAIVVGRSRVEQFAYGIGGMAGCALTLWWTR